MSKNQWKETLPGCYERPLDKIEDTYAAVGAGGHTFNREHWAITASIKVEFESNDFELAIKNAWTALRMEQPNLASTVVNSKKIYQLSSESEIESWIKETFIVNYSGISAEQLFPELRPVARATLYVLPRTKELVLRTSHHSVDGFGIIMIFDSLVRLMATPKPLEFGKELSNLSPPFNVAACIPNANAAQLEKVGTEMNAWLGNLPSIGLPATNTDRHPGISRRQTLVLSRDETRKVVVCAKSLGFTPTHVVHAAIILATAQLSGIPITDPRKYATFAVFNLRDKCPAPFNSSAHAFTAYHTGWPIVINPASFHETSLQLKEYYTNRKADPDLLPMVAPLFTKLKAVASASATGPKTAPPSEPVLSSLGIVDKELLRREQGAIKVVDFWIALDMLTPQLNVFLWTFGGCLTVEACYNEEFHSEYAIEQFLGLVKDGLFNGLKF